MLCFDVYAIIASYVENMSIYKNLSLTCITSSIGCKQYINEKVKIYNQINVTMYDCGCRCSINFYITPDVLDRVSKINRSETYLCIDCINGKYYGTCCDFIVCKKRCARLL